MEVRPLQFRDDIFHLKEKVANRDQRRNKLTEGVRSKDLSRPGNGDKVQSLRRIYIGDELPKKTADSIVT